MTLILILYQIMRMRNKKIVLVETLETSLDQQNTKFVEHVG